MITVELGGTVAVKNDKQYEALRDKGMSKERAATIATPPGIGPR
jgi:hypothetical protein